MSIKRTTLAEKQELMRARQKARPGRPPRSRSQVDPSVAERVRVRTFAYRLLEKGHSYSAVAIELQRAFGKQVPPEKIQAWYEAGAPLAA